MTAASNRTSPQPAPPDSAPRQLSLNLPFRPALAREDFAVAACNDLAAGWVDRWPDWPESGLVLHGPAGCGKTHLAAVWRAQSGARVVNDAMLDLEAGRALAESGAALLLEDIDSRLAAVPAWQETLLHLYNASRCAGGSLLMTARKRPAAWRVRLPDLKSRLLALPAAAIALPDDAVLEAVMKKRFSDRQLDVPSDLVRYVLPRIERSFSAVHAFVERIDTLALERKRKVNRPLAMELLQRMDRQEPPKGDQDGSGA